MSAAALLGGVLTACGSSGGGDSDTGTEIPVTVAAKGAGTEERAWIAGPAPDLTSAVRYGLVEQETTITVRDGTVLGAKLLLPQGVADGPWPCVLMANGYGHNTAIGTSLESIVKDLAARGYASVHLSLRGSGNSEGVGDLYNQFGPDGYDVVEWMAAQSWCNGTVGMVGPSLLGISQWLTAKELPPSLKAIVPHVACGNCYDALWYPGGMLPGPGRVARGDPEYTTAIQHRDFDDWWVERSTSADDHRMIAAAGVAVMTTGGWGDYISPANLVAFEDIPNTASKKMIWGPDAHGGMLADPQPHSFLEYQAQWLDHHLRGIANGVGDPDKTAVIYVQGPDQWRNEPNWPIQDTDKVRLFLQSTQSGTIASLNDGSLTTAGPVDADSAPASIDYSPGTGPFLATLLSSTAGRVTGDQSANEGAVLTWTSAPAPLPTEITGRVNLTLWAGIQGVDADFVALLTDVAPDGTSRQITAGYLNASRARSRSAPEIVPQNTAIEYTVTMDPVSYVLQGGHRLRLDIAGGAEPTPDMAGTPQGPGQSSIPATISVFHDLFRASSLEIPVIGRAAALEFGRQ
jgi:predicted acyl esterase